MNNPNTGKPMVVRRDFLRGALATAVMAPIGATLASCAAGGTNSDSNSNSGGAKKTAKNPFGLADGTKVDAVIFNGGYGYSYVQFAGKQVEKQFPKVDVSVKPSTNISQELQPRFAGGNPPDLIDNSGEHQIGIGSILDQLADLSDVVEANNYEGTKIKDTLFGGVLKANMYNGKMAVLNYAMTVYAVWYSDSLFKENGWTVPETWDAMMDLGAKAKAAGKYLFCWGKEAATYYQTFCFDSAIKEGGDEVRLALDNIEANCFSHPAVQGAFKGLEATIKAGYMKPGGSGTKFTAAQAQWSNAEEAILYPSGGWIENEMKKQTKAGFKMMGAPTPTVSDNSKMPYTAIHSTAGEPFVVPKQGKNVAGGKELLRAMLSKDAASNFAKTRLASTIVKGTVPADGFGSTALKSQTTMLDNAGDDVFSWNFVSLYGTNTDMLVPWNTFLAGKMDVATLTKTLQGIVDKVRNDDSVKKIKVT